MFKDELDIFLKVCIVVVGCFFFQLFQDHCLRQNSCKNFSPSTFLSSSIYPSTHLLIIVNMILKLKRIYLLLFLQGCFSIYHLSPLSLQLIHPQMSPPFHLRYIFSVLLRGRISIPFSIVVVFFD